MSVMLLAERGAAPPAGGRPGPAFLAKPPGPDGLQATTCGPQTAEEAVVALALTVSWMLVTGRHLDQRSLLHTLPAEQLIDFWADDYTIQTPVTSYRPATRSWAVPCR